MKTFSLTIMVAILSLLFSTINMSQTQPAYKDVVVENPTAEVDMKVVSDFVNSLVSGDLDKAKSLLDPNYIGRGPSKLDSANVEMTITGWQANNKRTSDRKIAFVTQTFKVLSGNLKGNWVSLWGDYTFTQDGKTISFPLQYTALVADGKIMGDQIYYDNLYVVTQLGYTITPPKVEQK